MNSNKQVQSARRNAAKHKGQQSPSGQKGRSRGRQQSAGPAIIMAESYFASLVDPFNNQGCPLGWGCMVPSTITTLYVRGVTAAATDGSFAIMALPNNVYIGTVANQTHATSFASTGVTYAATDAAAIAANFAAGRIISIGVKAIPSIAATSAPGASYSGALEGIGYTISQALTPDDLAASPVAIQGLASTGARATGRPMDTNSFAFQSPVTDAVGYTGNTPYPCSIPFVAFLGLPANAAILYEIVVNIEVLALTKHGTAPMDINNSGASETLASYWPSFESLWAKIRPALPAPGKPSLEWSSVGTSLNSMAGALGTMGSIANGVLNLGGAVGRGARTLSRLKDAVGTNFSYPRAMQRLTM